MCLKCEKMSEKLSQHLQRDCMKDDPEELRKTELERAKASQHNWGKNNRILDLNEYLQFLKPEKAGSFCRALEAKGFIVLNQQELQRSECTNKQSFYHHTNSSKLI